MPALLRIALAAAVLLLPFAWTHAQGYPSRPIRLVVPWPPAGPSDILARALTQKLPERLQQSVVIDNRAGASGTIGADIVAKATPDGHTMLVDNITAQATNPALYKKLPFDTVRDFAPVSLMARVNNVLVVHPSTPVSSVKDIVAAARAKPGELAYASFGPGSTAHLAGELFKAATGVSMIHVPYKGGAPALTDLMAGRVYMMFATMPSAFDHVRNGKLKAVAVTGSRRSSVMPNVATVIESGLAGFEATNYYGAMFPAKTPAAIVARMNNEINASITAPEVVARLSQVGFEMMTSTTDEFARVLEAEAAKWGKVVRDAGASLD
jgi:tripartite-type tricarboxylate transporter receptor subunit TctC